LFVQKKSLPFSAPSTFNHPSAAVQSPLIDLGQT
jgi:hypothetical protein